MPTVPRYEANQVREAGLPQGRIDARVSADAFGAGEARALSGAFQEAGKIVQDYTNYADQVAIMEAQKKATELETTLLYDPKVGALNQKGKNAFTLQESVPAAYKKGIEEISAGLNERQKMAFGKLTMDQGLRIDRNVQRHVSGEISSYDNAETIAFVETQKNAAIEGYRDPGRVALSIQQQQTALAAHGQRIGLPPDQVKLLADKAASETHTAVLERYMNGNEDIKAQEYYDANKDFLVGKDKVAVEKAIEISSLRGKSQRESDRILSKYSSLTPALEEAKDIEDPKLRDETVRRVNEGFTQRRQAERLDLEQAHIGAVNTIDKTGSIDNIPPRTWDRFTVSERNSLIAYARNKNNGVEPETKWDLYYEMKTQAASPELRDVFLRTNLYKYRNLLADAEFKELVNAQTQLRSGKGSTKDLDGFLTDMQIATQALREIKVKPDSPQGVAFYRRMDQEVKALQDRTGKKATNEDLQRIADDLRIRGVTDKGWLWDTKKYKFETMPDESFDIKASDVPKEERYKIESALKRKNLPVTDEAVLDLYKRMRGQGNGA